MNKHVSAYALHASTHSWARVERLPCLPLTTEGRAQPMEKQSQEISRNAAPNPNSRCPGSSPQSQELSKLRNGKDHILPAFLS